MVGQQKRYASQAEDAVGDQHGALVAVIQVHQDVLRARDQDAHVAVVLRGSDTHSSDPVSEHIRPQKQTKQQCQESFADQQMRILDGYNYACSLTLRRMLVPSLTGTPGSQHNFAQGHGRPATDKS